MIKLTTGVRKRAQRVVLYGTEGIGKSTLASYFPKAVFIDTEDGTGHMDVARIEKPDSFDDLIFIIKEIADNGVICKTLILDTADWCEQIIIDKVLKENDKKSIEGIPYGKGYTMVAEKWQQVLKAFDMCIAKGIHVVITAHAKMQKIEQPDDMGSYDHWGMKLSKQAAPLIKEWADMVLFLNYKTITVATDRTGEHKKATGAKRVMYTTHTAWWDAKNRHGLPDELPMEYASIAHLFDDKMPEPEPLAPEIGLEAKPAEDTPLEKLNKLMIDSQIAEQELRQLVANKGHFPMSTHIEDYPVDFITGWLIPYWSNIVSAIEADPNRLPF